MKVNSTIPPHANNPSASPSSSKSADRVTVASNDPPHQPTESLSFASASTQAITYGERVREQVRVQSVAPGIIKTTIKPLKQGEATIAGDNTPFARMQNLMNPHSEYTRLTVVGGASATRVIGTKEGALPERPEALSKNTPAPTAIVNGGYFIHKPGLIGDDGKHITNIGATIGPTSHRGDHQPISRLWKPYYGQIMIDGKTSLCSGPLLARNGKQEAVPFGDKKFIYRPDGKNENELNKYGGSMTPSGDPIERSAISVNPSKKGSGGDVVMHALTAGGSRKNGVAMAVWQKLTQIGADSAQGHAHSSGARGNASTLALDGGGSTYLGILDGNGVTTLAHGRGGISGDSIRPTPNVIVSTPAFQRQEAGPTEGRSGHISIDQAPQDEK
ncbi:phosphodiester glycosidase family protein [Brenneria rubrifaciens]|uniref:Phosphodiester glycosidase domain-containing protein n=1 Tax=Brenneria rubrifaciens TaxID=55213 RepID=A0A4P8QSC6_9GAMM|nr:phosphodiester glycosidase family protein [Brenneria rubrifaciens]QCR10081.1 hypothetical protein EH207_17175 [Brenneria rubrifaciens]